MAPKPLNYIVGKVYNRVAGLLEKFFPLASPCYSVESIWSVLLLASLDNTSAEAICAEHPSLPSADTVLREAAGLGQGDLLSGFEGILDVLFSVVRSMRILNQSVDLAIDSHDDRYYGDKDDEGVVGTKPERGTCYAYRVFTVDIVTSRCRFTLSVIPFMKGMKNADLVYALIEKARKYVRVRSVLLDGGFYEAEVLAVLEKLNVKYVIRADKSGKLRNLLEMADREKGVIMPWKVAEKDTILVAVYVEKKGTKPIEPEWHAWVTNMALNPREISELYRRRWGIETGYRVKEDFHANTTSKKYLIRLLYSLLAICLYNVWVLINLLEDLGETKDPPEGKKYKPAYTTRIIRKEFEKLITSSSLPIT